MTKIKDRGVYKIDTSISGKEGLIGSDVDEYNKTKTYTIDQIRDFIAGSVEGFEQNNIVRLVSTTGAIGVNYDLPSMINDGEINWEYSPDAGVTGQINILDSWNIVFRVPVGVGYANQKSVYYDYYLLMNQGKGVIGLNSGVTLTGANFRKIDSTKPIVLPTTDGSQGAPTVFTIYGSDLTNEEDVLNQALGSYIIDNSASDFYFVMQQLGKASTPTSQNTRVFRFVGVDGVYGSAGVDEAVFADFIEVNSDQMSSTSPTAIEIRTFTTGSIISHTGGDNIVQAVNRSFKGIINHVSNSTLTIEVFRQILNADLSYGLAVEGWKWTGGIGEVNDGNATEYDFTLDYRYNVITNVVPDISAEPSIDSIGTPNVELPEDAINDSETGYSIDNTKDQVFTIFNNDADSSEFKIYKFIGANGAYGYGGALTAVNGDFEEIISIPVEDQNLHSLSQLKNDVGFVVTGSDIKALYENELNTNAFTDAQKTKVDNVAVTGAVDLDVVKTKTDFISVTGAVDLDVVKTKTDFISVTGAVDLDAIDSKVTAFSNNLMKAEITIPSALLSTLGATKVNLIPAQAGKTVKFLYGSGFLDYNSILYDFASQLEIQYETSGSIVALIDQGVVNGTADAIFDINKGGVSNAITPLNEGLDLYVLANPTTGNSVLKLILYFAIVDFSF